MVLGLMVHRAGLCGDPLRTVIGLTHRLKMQDRNMKDKMSGLENARFAFSRTTFSCPILQST